MNTIKIFKEKLGINPRFFLFHFSQNFTQILDVALGKERLGRGMADEVDSGPLLMGKFVCGKQDHVAINQLNGVVSCMVVAVWMNLHGEALHSF